MAYQEARTSTSGGHRVMHSETRRPIETVIINIVYFIFGVIITLLALRFILLLFGANPDAGFSQIIYTLTAPFMAPFFSVFGTTRLEGSVFEWSTLLAIVIYALMAWGIAALVDAVTPRASAGTVETVEEYHGDEADEGVRDYGRDEYVEGQDAYRGRGPGAGPVVHR